MSNSSNETPDSFDRLDEMLSLMFDDQLTDEQVAELNQMLKDDADARRRSVEAAQLHADLFTYFNKDKSPSEIAPPLPLSIPGMGLPTGS